MIQEREGKVIGEINHFFLHYLSSSADVTELRSLPPLLMFAQSLGSNVIFYLRTSISVTSRHIKQDILTTNSDPSHNFPSLNSSQYVHCTGCLRKNALLCLKAYNSSLEAAIGTSWGSFPIPIQSAFI